MNTKTCTPAGTTCDATLSAPTFQPRVDVVEHPDRLVLLFDVPGADESSLRVELEDRSLTISATLDQAPPEGLDIVHREFTTGNYLRRFSLPVEVERDAIEASYDNGVLEVTVPKAKATLPRQIEIQQS